MGHNRLEPASSIRYRYVPSASIVALGVLLILELTVRALGYRASVNDDPGLWRLAFSRLSTSSGKTLAVVGASRSRYGLDLAVLDRCLDRESAQLSIDGGGVAPILQRLVHVDSSLATVVISLMGASFDAVGESRSEVVVSAAAREPELAELWDRWTVAQFERNLALMSSELSIRSVYNALRSKGALPSPNLQLMDVRRSTSAPRQWLDDNAGPARDIGFGDELVVPTRWLQHPGHSEWHAKFAQMMLDVMALVDAGVDVYIVMMPSSGIVREVEVAAYPRSEYWSVVEHSCRDIGCITIHFEDWPELADYQPADDSHLDDQDQTEFTTALCHIMKELHGQDVSIAADSSPPKSAR